MKSFSNLLLTAFLLTGIVVSCYDETAVMDKIDGLDSRISALEQQMQTANSNISSLQTITAALQKNVSVTSVTEVEGGYKLVFSNGSTAVIKNGSEGHTPSIGVKQDSDGVYYWTLDGNWLLDAKGNKVRVTGEDGKPGSDAVAPQLKIEKGFWYLSTDGGATWSQLGKATGEDGDAWFKDVKVDEDYVYLTLADGTVLKLLRSDGPIVSVAVIPDYNDGSVKAGSGLFTIRFNVEPSGSAQSLLDLANDCFTLKAVYTLTKAEGDIITLPIHKKQVEDGILTITTTGEDLAPEFASKKIGVNAALFISDDTFAVNTGYFQLWPKNEYMGHEYVDLGLESGNMWAQTNLGAENPEDPGDFYAWGELEPKDHYSWDNYLLSVEKYSRTKGKESFKDYNYEDDVVRHKWGGQWRTPSENDWRELTDEKNFTWTWTERNGKKGYEVKSKKKGYTDQSIFLPAAGYMQDYTLIGNADNPAGHYWSSDAFFQSGAESYLQLVFDLQFDSKKISSNHVVNPPYGQSIHPVLGKYEAKNVTGISIAPGTLTLAVGMVRHLVAKLIPEDADNPKVTWTSSNPGVAAVSEDGIVTAFSIGTATITVKSVDGGYTATCAVTVKDESELAPQAVDLGLPSGVKWATFNVGATSPEDYGDYYAWAETEPYYQPGHALDDPCKDWKSGKGDGYAWGSYKWSTGNTDNLTKYNDADNALSFKDYNYQDDPARVNWGGEWRTPTRADMMDLQEYCYWAMETVNNVFGCRITSKINGNSIFIPACGYREGINLKLLGTECNYMTATGIGKGFHYMLFHKPTFGYSGVGNGVYKRCYGVPVRPVLGEENVIPITSLSIDQTEITLTPGQTCKLHAIVEPETATFKHSISWSCTDNGVVKVGTSGLVTALMPGQATVTVQTHDGEFKATCTVTVSGGSEDTQEVVDLGLPSGIKWAKCNLGAKSEEEYGDYFAWGETEPYYQDGYAYSDVALWKSGKEAGYDWPSYRWCTGDWDLLTKYNTSSYYGSTVDDITTLTPDDDAAAAALGGGWRMPTQADWEDLMNPDNCEWTWTTCDGVLGYRVTSKKNGNSIFLPACGRRDADILDIDENEPEDANGYYWSSTLSEYSCNALARCFFKGSQSPQVDWYDEPRCYGFAVRPVLDAANAGHSVERQWVYEYEYDGQTCWAVYDFGASFPRRLFWKAEPISRDSLPFDQFDGKLFSIVQLPDGGIKVCSDDPSHMWYTFYDVTETTATIACYYSSEYYTKEDIFEIRGRYPVADSYGWKHATITVKARQPFEKLKWEQWVLDVDGYKYRLAGSEYDNAGGDQYKFFVNSVLHGQASTIPIVRMNNYGTEADFAKVDVKGKIAVLDRGGDPVFYEKYENASKAGAIAVICVNNREDVGPLFANLAGVGDDVKKIPFVTVIQEAGKKLNGKSSATFTFCTDPGEIVGY